VNGESSLITLTSRTKEASRNNRNKRLSDNSRNSIRKLKMKNVTFEKEGINYHASFSQ